MAETKRKKAAGKTPKATKAKDPVLFTRISSELDADLDAWVQDLQREHPGFSISKSDLVRDVLIRAVRERKAGGQGGT